MYNIILFTKKAIFVIKYGFFMSNNCYCKIIELSSIMLNIDSFMFGR